MRGSRKLRIDPALKTTFRYVSHWEEKGVKSLKHPQVFPICICPFSLAFACFE
jgi:hypothetical protein